MDLAIVSEVSEQIMQAFLSDRKIQEGLMVELIANVTKYIRSGIDETLSQSFFRLTEYVRGATQSLDIRDKPPDVILDYGKIMSIASMIDTIAYAKASEERMEEDAKHECDVMKLERDDKRYYMLKVIYENRGISHKNLAAATNASPSRLSQIVGQMKNDRYFICHQIGRCKYYYITDIGETLLKRIDEKIDQPVATEDRTIIQTNRNITAIEEYVEICKAYEGLGALHLYSFLLGKLILLTTKTTLNSGSIYNGLRTRVVEPYYEAKAYILDNNKFNGVAEKVQEVSESKEFDLFEETNSLELVQVL